MHSTSHMLGLSDRGPQGLFFPLGEDDDDDAHNSSTNANTYWVLTGHQAPGTALGLSCPNSFNLHNKPKKIIALFDK